MSESSSSSPVFAAPLVDAHIHPDKSSWGGPWLSRGSAGTLRDLIEADISTQRQYTRSVEERVYALLSNAVANGTRAVRAHIDIAPGIGLGNVLGTRAAAERLSKVLDVQIVAFPQQGLLTAPGTLDLMGAALGEGADVVGGIDPMGIDGDVDGHLDAVFGLAHHAGVPLDIHLHDDGPTGLSEISQIAQRTIDLGMQGRVTISHAFALASDGPDVNAALDRVATAELWLATCALGPDPVLPIATLRARGIRVAAGSDGVRDAWSPFGTGSMIDRAHLLAYRTGAITDDELEHCYELCSRSGAELLGLDPLAHPVDGDAPDRLEFEGENLAQVVVDRPAPRRVIRDGRAIARDGVLQP